MKIIKATSADKQVIVDILCQAFAEEPQTLYMLGEGGNKQKRLARLMSYAFEKAMVNGKVELTEDKKAAAIWRNHHSQKWSFRLLIETLLFLKDFGFRRLSRITKMENSIVAHYPKEDTFYYLWILGTSPSVQGLGYGSALMKPWIEKSQKEQIQIYLETSTESNLSFYQKKGFTKYEQIILEGTNNQEVFLMRTA
ncbi:MAG: GNAT family N-acetyltransferase [Leadbetterella sp.]